MERIAWFSDESGEYASLIQEQNGLSEKRKCFEHPTFY